MLIVKKRIRSLNSNLPTSLKGKKVAVALKGIEDHKDALAKAGFTDKLGLGETVLPASVGKVSEYNAEGRYEPQKDKPKETVYRQVLWTHMEWRGPYQEEVTSIVDRPYKRYPRKFFPPPGVELTVAESKSGDKVVTTDPIQWNAANEESLLHVVNLFLELFGECSVLTGDLADLAAINIQRLNWKILPEGEYPWDKLNQKLQPIIQRRSAQPGVVTARLATINKYQPDFVAVGQGGFEGYVVFGFPQKDLYVLESANENNATYVFDKNWKALSQLSKADILDGKLQKDRLIHRKYWAHQVRKLLV